MRVAIDIRRMGDFGLGTYTRNIVRALARRRSEIRYLLIGRAQLYEQLGKLPENFELLDYPAEPGSVRTHVHLPAALAQRGVDILHMPWFYAPVVVPCRMVITVHDLTELVYARAAAGGAILQAGRRHFARRALLHCARIISVSQAAKRELARVFTVPESKIEVIYNALDESFRSEPYPRDDALILERHAISYPFVLYAGNIRPHKNLPRLIEAFSVAKAELRGNAEFDHLKLLVIGDELGQHPDLRRTVVRTRVREDVRFLGFVPHPVLRVLYKHARAFLFPSLYEGFGLPPLEAMAHGTPVLTSNVSSLPEVFGDSALLVNPEKVFEIARGIRQILTDEELRARLIRAGEERVKMYSWDRAAQQLEDVYRTVMTTDS
jgi:glycosyltransferase involved in cell wall biosynthesis